MSTSTTSRTVYASSTGILSSRSTYRFMPVELLLHEVSKRGLFDVAKVFHDHIDRKLLIDLLHLDDGEKLAAQGQYQDLTRKQLRHQCEMVGVSTEHTAQRTEMIKKLLAVDNATARQASGFLSLRSSMNAASCKRCHSPDSGYESTPKEHEWETGKKRKIILVKKDGITYSF
jgi:hypothetical protein